MATNGCRNLMAEMVRVGITAHDIARVIEKDLRTAQNKISGKSQFYINEGFLIQEKFFPQFSVEYLFGSISLYEHNTTSDVQKKDKQSKGGTTL